MKPSFTPIAKSDGLWEDDRASKEALLDEAIGELNDALKAIKEISKQETALSDADVRCVLNEYLRGAYVNLRVCDQQIRFVILLEGIYENTLEAGLQDLIEEWFSYEETFALEPWAEFHNWLGAEL